MQNGDYQNIYEPIKGLVVYLREGGKGKGMTMEQVKELASNASSSLCISFCSLNCPRGHTICVELEYPLLCSHFIITLN
jgi:hypothetical protein